jgi:phenylalanyl-tRNA synthetase beta chain
MNILIPDSWLREHLDTKATPKQIMDCLSLCGPSVERISKTGNDFVYDIEITSNRVDMASVYGIAREASAILPRFGIPAKLKEFKTNKPQEPKNILPMNISDPEKICNRILGIVMEVDQMKPSPVEIKTLIEKSGVRSLNNLVDITNYVMLEIGHPCHVFDYDRIKTHQFLIRFAQKNEPIITLDNKKYFLNEEDVIIDDTTGRVIDLPGIMGTENSVVNETTRRILFFIESNNPNIIRKTSMRYGIRTMAANINEKHPDVNLAKQAMEYGISLFEKLAGGKVASELIDIYPCKENIKTIEVARNFITKRLGIELSLTEISEILESLSFEISVNNDLLKINPPSFRQHDIQIPEDIVEEIARIYGYHNLPNNLMTGVIPITQKPLDLPLEEKAKTVLKFLGLTETYSYSMLSSELLKKTGLDTRNTLKISNPLTEELVYMRKSLIPQMLFNLSQNQKQKEKIAFFELSKTYIPQKDDLPVEDNYLCIGLLNQDFLHLKGILEVLLEEIGIPCVNINPSLANSFFQPEQAGEIVINNKTIGKIGNISQKLLNNFTITKNVALLELNFSNLVPFVSKNKKFLSISSHPPVLEDLALIIKPKTYIENLINTIKNINPLIKQAFLYDSFGNTRTIRIVYQNQNRTLTENDVKPIRENILQILKDKFGAQLKTSNQTTK